VRRLRRQPERGTMRLRTFQLVRRLICRASQLPARLYRPSSCRPQSACPTRIQVWQFPRRRHRKPKVVAAVPAPGHCRFRHGASAPSATTPSCLTWSARRAAGTKVARR
jgi:hypothetical protein